MTTRRQFLSTAAIGAAALAAPMIGRAQTQYKSEYKLSVVGNRPIPLSEGAFRWAEMVTQRSQGRINVRVYPGSQLVGGDQTRELTAMRQGTIDMLVSSTINLSPTIQQMNLFSLPFLMPDARAFDALIAPGPVRTALEATLTSRDSVPLAWGENGFRELSNSRLPVRTPADLRGLKIRYAAGRIFHEIFEGLGANPLQMSFADLQPALTTGAVDGQENPINLYLAFRMDTLAQRHLTVWNYVADAGVFQVSKANWDTFTPADRDLLKATAEEAARDQVAAARRGITATDRASFEELARRNVAVVELTAAEKQVFATATRPIFDRYATQVGADLVRAAEAAIQRRS